MFVSDPHQHFYLILYILYQSYIKLNTCYSDRFYFNFSLLRDFRFFEVSNILLGFHSNAKLTLIRYSDTSANE